MSSTIKVNNIQNLAGDDSGIDLSTNDQIILKTANTTAITVDSSQDVSMGGKLGIGASTIDSDIHLEKASDLEIKLERTGSGTSTIGVPSSGQLLINNTSNADMLLSTNNTERMRIKNGGNVLVGTTNQSPAESSSATGIRLGSNGGTQIGTSGLEVMRINRNSDDGTLINFCQASTSEGHISISGTTVSYNGGHLSRWSQLTDNNRDDTIVKGTVMTNLDQMAEWTTDGVTEDNEQLNCMAVSSVEGDANVAGVFVNWDNDDNVYTNDMNVAMTGDMVIRIAKGTKVARGDLLMSAGDGTAKPQADDIVRSKTIAKVTSTNVSHTYDDGTYLVPCVLLAC